MIDNIKEIYKDGIMFLYIDLFCGAGGTSTGVELSTLDIVHRKPLKFAKVIACVNHDKNAIASHAANHPNARHYTEDIRTLDLTDLVAHVALMRQVYKNAKIVLWISAECTSHSNAKGGTSRDPDSRSLPEEMYRYIKAIDPDIIQVENVKEFLDWGPLIVKVVRDKKTKEELYCPLDFKKEKKKRGQKQIIHIRPTWIPDPKYKKTYYNRWIHEIQDYGYHYDYKLLNAADYSAHTRRIRYFGIFAKEQKYITFPTPTHSKDGKKLPKWKSVKEVLYFTIEGESIFGRKKDLSEPTLTRIYSGLIKFVAGGQKNFIQQRNSGNPNSKIVSINSPARTITSTGGNQELVSTKFLSVYNGNGQNQSLEQPSLAICCKDRFALIDPRFIMNNYSGGGQISDINHPSPTINTVPKQNLVNVRMIDQQYGQSKPASVDTPIGSLTKNPKFNLIEARWIANSNFNNVGHSIEEPAPTICAGRRHHYLMNPQFSSPGSSIDDPCFTLIARMDKKPPYFVTVVYGKVVIEIYNTDSPMTKKIKEFMAMYGIVDILMRMLLIPELMAIMGFPKKYKLIGTQTEQKKYIGNAVEVNMAKAMCTAIGWVEIEELLKAA
ncbi:MAG: DNA cytosine methyltransferase [Dysgonamonadaceae bacterium]|jgi:DNA (cytosine-5)-methyltransferase 1|nr:DNA cytosine methyltransferase [Dysgonamonadaceae bacterium]